MNIVEITPKSESTNLYQPRFSDDERHVLIIDDERGGKVELRGREIGQLYRALRPALEG